MLALFCNASSRLPVCLTAFYFLFNYTYCYQNTPFSLRHHDMHSSTLKLTSGKYQTPVLARFVSLQQVSLFSTRAWYVAVFECDDVDPLST